LELRNERVTLDFLILSTKVVFIENSVHSLLPFSLLSFYVFTAYVHLLLGDVSWSSEGDDKPYWAPTH
jgi:hypothetical protein